MGQRSPDDGRIVFLHRGFAKFWSPSLYPPDRRRAWLHTCTQVVGWAWCWTSHAQDDFEPWLPVPAREAPNVAVLHPVRIV